MTLSQFAELDHVDMTLAALHSHRQRGGREFPDSQGRGEKNAHLYRLDDLNEWLARQMEAAL